MRTRMSVAVTGVLVVGLFAGGLVFRHPTAGSHPATVSPSPLHQPAPSPTPSIVSQPSPSTADRSSLVPSAPREQVLSGDPVLLKGSVALVTTNAPKETVELANLVVADAGGTAATEATAQLVIGVGADSPALPDGVQLPTQPEGYVLTTGTSAQHPSVNVVGSDAEGLRHGLERLRDLEADGVVPGTTIRDWPLMRTRGVVEGFYGPPWSLQERIDILRWSARHRLNTYMYAPKDDVHLRERWREPYPQTQLEELQRFAEEAAANHIQLIATLSPGQDICYSSDQDFESAIEKFEELRAVGFTAFSIALDDIDPTRMCSQDRSIGGGGSQEEQVARAQAHFVNRVQREYLTPNGLPDMVLTPTKYHGISTDPARSALSQALDDAVTQVWTGDGIVDADITGADAEAAARSFKGSKLLLWDNFPVNDGDLDRLFLGPLPARDATLHEHLDGVLVNPMLQPYASMPALAAHGSLAWHGTTVDPEEVRQAGVDELVGQPDQPNVAALLDTLSSWAYSDEPTATALQADIDAFDEAASGNSDHLATAEARLRERLALLRDAPAVLEDSTSAGFSRDLMPWAEAAAAWAEAGLEAIDVKKAVAQGDTTSVTSALERMSEARWRATTPIDGVVPTVADDALETFVGEAEASWESTAEAPAPEQSAAPRASTSLGQQEEHPAQAALDGNPATAWVSRFGPSEDSEFVVDLGEEQDLSLVQLRQGGTGDAAGDHFHDAVLAVSADGAEWQELGRVTRASVDLTAPAGTRARHIRIKATAPNPDGQWVQINEVRVS